MTTHLPNTDTDMGARLGRLREISDAARARRLAELEEWCQANPADRLDVQWLTGLARTAGWPQSEMASGLEVEAALLARAGLLTDPAGRADVEACILGEWAFWDDALEFEHDVVAWLLKRGSVRRQADGLWLERCPPLYREARLDDVDQPAEVVDVARQWLAAAGEGANLIVAGPVGTGKTFLAYALGRRWYAVEAAEWHDARLAEPPVIVHAIDLLGALRPGGHGDPGTYAGARLLVVDDLGAHRGTEWAEEQLAGIVDARARNLLPTIVTTNLAGEALARSVGDRVYDRLRAGALGVELVGRSRRTPRAVGRRLSA